MQTKIVYVLISSENDIYLEQAFVSMYSVKYYMPKSHIVLLTDKITSESFVGTRKEELQYVDELIVVDLDASKFNAQQRSRQLKTTVRKHIHGDYIFIDCDTIVVKPLVDIEKINAEIAACRDTHSAFSENPYRNMCIIHGKRLNWPIDEEKQYFNTGVIYVKDTPKTHEFYNKWNENLNMGYPKRVFMDQPSFAKTNYEMNHIVCQMPDVWNCELKYGIKYLRDAYIVHYLCTNASHFQNKQLFILNEKDILVEIKKTGIISENIKDTVCNPFNGLAELTHCFAGEDLYFFTSKEYSVVRRHCNKNKVSLLSILLKSIYYFEALIKKIKNIH